MEDLTKTEKLIGVCTDCGIAITSESDVGITSPKLRCRACMEKEKEVAKRKAALSEQKRLAHVAHSKSALLKSLIIPAVIICAVAILLIVVLPEYTVGTLIISALAYMATVQIIWDVVPLSSIFTFFLGGPKFAFGIIFDLSIDGFITYLLVKLGMWLVGIVLSVISFCLGAVIAMIISPFTFPFTLAKAIKNPEDIEYLI